MKIEKFPKISIVTPSFNSAKFIEDCIQSVLNQNYPNFEHIIIDGGSTDGTIEILKKYPHLKWISEPDEGQSDALNKGFKLASGDIIGWLNSDDVYLSGTFNYIMDEFQRDLSSKIIYGDWQFIDTNKKYIKKSTSLPFNGNMLIYYGPYLASVSFFVNKEVFSTDVNFDKKLKFVMDWDWFIKIYKAGFKFKYCKKELGAFRLTGENQSRKFENHSGFDRLFWRERQLLEGRVLKRFYGFHFESKIFGALLVEEFLFRTIWYFYRIKVITFKILKKI